MTQLMVIFSEKKLSKNVAGSSASEQQSLQNYAEFRRNEFAKIIFSKDLTTCIEATN